jgi:antitoxin MazE
MGGHSIKNPGLRQCSSLAATFSQLSNFRSFFLDFSKKCNYFVITNTFQMDISVISIGNSKGIRLTKTLIEKYNIKDTMELVLEKSYIILKPKTSPRKGWDKSFKKMHENGDDKLLISDIFEDENLDEWK